MTKNIILTGASGEIGSEVARRLAARGARLVLSSRREERLLALAKELVAAGGQEPTVLPANLGQPGEAARLARGAQEALGEIDVLINNAGASLQGLSWVVGDRDEAREVLETNLWSPLALTAALTPRMLDRGRGAVVNIGSMAWISPFPHLGHYAASRAALAAATQVMELELSPRGIRVVEVALGPIDTPASRENRGLVGAERWLDGRPGLGDVGSAAAAIAAAVEGDAHGVVFSPRILRWAHRFPRLGERYSRRVSKHADLEDTTVRFGGSTGHPDLLRLRNTREPAVGERR
jgi:uncharacterized protein